MLRRVMWALGSAGRAARAAIDAYWGYCDGHPWALAPAVALFALLGSVVGVEP